MNDNWDMRWMGLAHHIAGWSKDLSRKLGAVIVDDRQVLVSIGWNGFPRGLNDDVASRHARPAKYIWTEHAERNAIANAAAKGISTLGGTMYISWYPCADCARMIIQSGISRLVCIEPAWDDPTYVEHFSMVREMFEEIGLIVSFVEGDAPLRKDL